MSGEAFTKGEWQYPHLCRDVIECNCTTISHEGYHSGLAFVQVSDGFPVAEGGNDAPSAAEARANAYLIASAPNMYRALQEVDRRLNIEVELRQVVANRAAKNFAGNGLLGIAVEQDEDAIRWRELVAEREEIDLRRVAALRKAQGKAMASQFGGSVISKLNEFVPGLDVAWDSDPVTGESNGSTRPHLVGKVISVQQGQGQCEALAIQNHFDKGQIIDPADAMRKGMIFYSIPIN